MQILTLEKRRILVTGATGLVGTGLVERLLAQGAEVIALVRNCNPRREFFRSGIYKHVTIVTGNLEDFNVLDHALVDHEVDGVFHLGAQAIVPHALKSPLRTFETNVRGTYNLLEACRVHSRQIRFVVVASSDKAYGSLTSDAYHENSPLAGRYPYDVSKSCTDLLAQSYFFSYQVPVAIARCGNIYGPGDTHWSRIVPGTIRSAFLGERPIIRSDGTYVRDYISLFDVVDAYLCLAYHVEQGTATGHAFNFSTESAKSVLEMVNAILECVGRLDLKPKILNEASFEIKRQTLDASKARTMLKWKSNYDFVGGLEKTLPWYEHYLETKRIVE